MKTIALPSGERVPALGQGTWNMGDRREQRAAELAALRLGLDQGLTLIDTAEMYGNGRSESLVGEAIAGRRDEVFLVSKVLPENASKRGTAAACEASLKRLGTDRIDLYAATATNQLLYNLTRRGIEWDLRPWLRERRIPVMAYSPLEQARLLRHTGLVAFARRHAMTPAQAALAWLLAQDDVIVIPKSGDPARVQENIGTLGHSLTPAQLAELDTFFPPPAGPQPLEML
ncbi:MAG: aldo/keto reductase [Betaproteobacteria bacterium]|nr:aldo/keto reductase [Betaproteobacteria bacterium]